ncbi:hypothetical protein SAMN04488515_2173 [Cognatiyoonia koreensis]|uniref:Uncharacterized protein n=1 Tax=Cognatiyoonia koreensis TaxID=364200 RepID=A0A1I0QTH0_9RHOB|nr:hypothetical protein [Cognatiyoonia koreensis]SEW30695.1 hypothetical protein SAMN04488515_2173 [Cognatiyoonia koreensis]
MSNTQILLLIACFLLLTLGSFVYFVATWDAEKEQPVSIILPEILPPEASALTKGAIA